MRPLLLTLLTALTTSAWAVGGDTRENVTQSGFSAESPDLACAAAAKQLKRVVTLNGWKVLSKGNVPCDCKTADGGWRCSLTALVEKPDDDTDGYRN